MLHFFYQLGRIGYYISGAVALFFLFAIVTGVIVHWKKIISNFYVFRPLAKLKTIWTDAHTVLGMIGIPFQFVYALTVALFGLGILVSISGSMLYGGDKEKFYEVMYENHEDSLGARSDTPYVINHFMDSALTKWEDFTPKYISLQNCASTTMQFSIGGKVSAQTKFFNNGNITYDVATGQVTKSINPHDDVDYNNAVMFMVYTLHFGEYNLNIWGSYFVKTIYFIMALITCFVIISGVLIWLTARNKKNVPEKQRRYNEGVGHIYLAICLTMYPITAISFIISKLLPEHVSDYQETILNSVFFGGWLLLAIFFWIKKNNYFTNKYTLLSGGVLGLLIPLVNGFSSGNWIWRTFLNHHYDVFVIDALWIVLSSVTLYSVVKMKKTDAPDNSDTKEKQETGEPQTTMKPSNYLFRPKTQPKVGQPEILAYDSEKLIPRNPNT